MNPNEENKVLEEKLNGLDLKGTADSKGESVEEADTNCTHDFNIKVIKEAVNSVIIEWEKFDDLTDVFEVEKFHRRRGWEQVAWTNNNRAIIENLDENFAYRLRIKALIYSSEQKAYIVHKISEDIVATTLAAQPTTLCLHRAIKKGQQFLVKRILRKRPSLIEYPGPNGYLPLANAIAFGENNVVDVLLTAGASVHKGNTQNGRTPLHLAFYYGHLPVARILLNKRANLEVRDANGMAACHFAIDAKQFEMLKFALENGADVEASDACGWTLLLRAVVMFVDVAMLKLLVAHGADRKAIDKLGQSCVDLARLYKHDEALKYFEHLHRTKDSNKETDS